MGLIRGTKITLLDRVETGMDAFNAPVYAETPVEVDNILICPASTEDVTEDFQMYGKRAVYELHIPKEDSHIWEDRVVEFYGQKWRTFGKLLIWMESLAPGTWNRKIKVERYG